MKLFHHWHLYAFGSAFFAGWVVIFTKIGVTHLPANVATLIRTLVVTLFLILLISWRGEWTSPFSMDKKGLFFLILSGLATGLSWICYFHALQIGPASGVVSMDKLSLVFAVLLAAFFLGENLNWQQWSGVLLMTCGALLVVVR